MKKKGLKSLPFMLFADSKGHIYEHPYFRMAGLWGAQPADLKQEDLIPLSEFSKLFYIPECPPIGLNPESGEYEVVPETDINGSVTECQAVAAFLEPGVVRSHLPALNYHQKSYVLPMWAYTAVGFKNKRYWAAGFRIEHNKKWDPINYDDRQLVPAIRKYQREYQTGPLLEHLINCAVHNHCFAAKNLFFNRWEAPLPVSQGCNASCLGCLSLQPEDACRASHQRIFFKPSRQEIVNIAASHLDRAKEAIISFGQGCEGEPLTEYELVSDSIREIRNQTKKGTINLNTNGSRPERVRFIIESGLDSIRISLNSVRPEFYRAYYRPRNYDFDDVVESIALSRRMGIYTMVNYLVFPGISDQEEEISALIEMVRETRVNFLHLKNLCIDPQFYLEKMPKARSHSVGMKQMIFILKKELPHLQLGYFNQPVR